MLECALDRLGEDYGLEIGPRFRDTDPDPTEASEPHQSLSRVSSTPHWERELTHTAYAYIARVGINKQKWEEATAIMYFNNLGLLILHC